MALDATRLIEKMREIKSYAASGFPKDVRVAADLLIDEINSDGLVGCAGANSEAEPRAKIKRRSKRKSLLGRKKRARK